MQQNIIAGKTLKKNLTNTNEYSKEEQSGHFLGDYV